MMILLSDYRIRLNRVRETAYRSGYVAAGANPTRLCVADRRSRPSSSCPSRIVGVPVKILAAE